jgi:hypothetical protein
VGGECQVRLTHGRNFFSVIWRNGNFNKLENKLLCCGGLGISIKQIRDGDK